jgi:photosystem II stability/assembly factor-like uncharacterized protein
LLLSLTLVGHGSASAEGWELEAPWPSSHELKGIHMFGPEEAWIVGSPMLSDNTGHILHTTDAGETWERTIVTTSSINAIYFHDSQHGWIVGNDTFRTTDGGQTWVKVNSYGSLYDVYFLDTMRGWACGNGAVAYWTTNGGVNWNPVGPIGGYTLSGIHFVDENTGWTCGIGGKIYHSTDGGRSWSVQLSDPSASFGSVQFFDSQEGWAMGADRFYHTTDGGTTWEFRAVPYGTWAYSGHFADDRLHGVAVGAWGNIVRTTDGGETWTTVAPQVYGNPHLWTVRLSDALHGFYVGERAMLYYTEDSGQTWGQRGNTGWFMTHGMDAYDDDHAWAACEAGEIMRTTDGGVHWERVFTPGIDTYGKVNDVSFYDVNEGYAVGKHEFFGGADMKVLRSLDGGASWHVRSTFHTPQDIKACDAVAPSTVVVLGVNDWTNDGLNISYDGGLTWTGISPSQYFIGNIDFIRQLGPASLSPEPHDQHLDVRRAARLGRRRLRGCPAHLERRRHLDSPGRGHERASLGGECREPDRVLGGRPGRPCVPHDGRRGHLERRGPGGRPDHQLRDDGVLEPGQWLGRRQLRDLAPAGQRDRHRRWSAGGVAPRRVAGDAQPVPHRHVDPLRSTERRSSSAQGL